MSEPVRVFVASAADLLTDHAPHGEGLIAWNLCSRLAERGHELVVCARAADLRAEPSFEVVETGRASRLESLEPLLYLRRVRRIFDAHGGAGRFDVVHWLFPQDRPALVPEAPSRLVVGPTMPRWPQVARTRPRRLGDLVSAAVSPLERALRLRALSAADSVLISSPAAVPTLPARVRDRAVVLPFGVDTARFEPAPLPPAPTIGFLGNLEEKKGARDLADAFAIAAAALPKSRLLVLGDGPERGEVARRLEAAGVLGRVDFRGRVGHDDVPAALAESSLVCLPSHGEPFGMTVLEALAAGRAVVSTDSGGPPHLLDHGRCGRLVPMRRPDLLARALVDLLADPAELERIGRENRARAEAVFDLDVVVDELELHYRAVAPREAGVLTPLEAAP